MGTSEQWYPPIPKRIRTRVEKAVVKVRKARAAFEKAQHALSIALNENAEAVAAQSHWCKKHPVKRG